MDGELLEGRVQGEEHSLYHRAVGQQGLPPTSHQFALVHAPFSHAQLWFLGLGLLWAAFCTDAVQLGH